ncbi:MAG: hypothetical protein Q9214_003780, partial [Letrouitia sp. 1 TL-2023]
MDPFSVAAGTVSLAGIISQTITATSRYVRSVANVRKQATTMVNSLATLERIIVQLNSHLQYLSAINQSLLSSNGSMLENTISSCQQRIGDISQKLLAAAGANNVWTLLRWPLDKKDHENALRDIQMYSQWIQLLLTLDDRRLLFQTLQDVNKVFDEQTNSVRALTEINCKRPPFSPHTNLEHQMERLATSEEAERYDTILNWISPIDPSTTQSMVSSGRAKGTCLWFLKDSNFVNWRDGDATSKILLIHGVPGCGKTVLVSLVIDELAKLSRERIGLAYVYFDHSQYESHGAEGIMASIVKQLCLKSVQLPKSIKRMFQQHRHNNSRPKLDELEASFQDLKNDMSIIYLVIDAIDECESVQRRILMDCLRKLGAWYKVKIFISCRSYLLQSIENRFLATSIEVEAQPSDLEICISTALEKSDALNETDAEFRDQLIDKLVLGANKMFLLPVLQLKHILQQPTAGEMRDALEQLPTDLYKVFEQTLERVRSQSQGRRRIGIRTLTWLVQAHRPLRIQELSEALAVRPGTSILDKAYCPSQQVILEACKGLVVVDGATSAVHLIHYAVQEHLKAGDIDSPDSVPPELGVLCVDYLSLDSVAGGPLEGEIPILDQLAKHPFLEYACLNWTKHFHRSTGANHRHKVMKLFKSPSKLQFIIQISVYLRGFREEYWCLDEVLSATPLHLACQLGLVDTIMELFDNGADVDATTSVCKHSPIHHAAANGHHEVLQLVLRAKPDIYRCN